MTTCDFTNRLAFTRVEAAGFLGLSPATIDRLAKSGKLNPLRATRRPLYTRVMLERFLAESCERTPVKHRDYPVVSATAKKGGE
jgi:hypothetical protein